MKHTLDGGGFYYTALPPSRAHTAYIMRIYEFELDQVVSPTHMMMMLLLLPWLHVSHQMNESITANINNQNIYDNTRQ